MSPDGDDEAAEESASVLPFATVQAAVDYADQHPNVARKVCVAGAASCAQGGYDEALLMRDGISVYGRYESTTWTRSCERTVLLPTTPDGIGFGPEVQSSTTLDGFDIYPLDELVTTGISIAGATGVDLSNIAIWQTTHEAADFVGIDIGAGSDVVLADTSIYAWDMWTSTLVNGIGVLSDGALLSLTNVDVVLRVAANSPVAGIWLADAGDLVLDDITVTATQEPGGGAGSQPAYGILVEGSGAVDVSADVSVEGRRTVRGIAIDESESAIVTADVTVEGGLDGNVVGIVADTDTAQIGVTVSASAINGDNVGGISCGPDCTIFESDVSLSNPLQGAPPPAGTFDGFATAIRCGSDCTLIDSIVTAPFDSVCSFSNCTGTTTGVVATGGGALIARNEIHGGTGRVALGLHVQGPARVENNVIEGGGTVRQISVSGARLSGAVDLHSNLIAAHGSSHPLSFGCLAIGVEVVSGAPIVRNNILTNDPNIDICTTTHLFSEAGGNPAVFQNNSFNYDDEQPLPAGRLYNNAGTPVTTVAEINALTDMVSGGNIPGSACRFPLPGFSACVDAGTPVGAPLDDIDGEDRDAAPDIGPDEYIDPCDGCDGHGTCAFNNNGICLCDSGYTRPDDDPMSCVDVDECATNNGGCDPLVTCTNTDGGRTCGDCPDGYVGTGDTQCVLENNPYVTLSAAHAHTCGVRSDDSIGCMGNNAYYWGNGPAPTEKFVGVAAGSGHTIGVREDGTLVFWGDDQNGLGSVPSGTFRAVSAEAAHDCAIRTDDTVTCWGWNPDGGATPPTGAFDEVSVGGLHTCGLRFGGSIECWGSNTFGESTPPSGTFLEVSAHGSQSCALRSDGTIACWGRDDLGEWTPPPAGTFLHVQVGAGFGCAMVAGGSLQCWGANSIGQSTPPSGPFLTYAVGNWHSCASRDDGTVACWGYSP